MKGEKEIEMSDMKLEDEKETDIDAEIEKAEVKMVSFGELFRYSSGKNTLQRWIAMIAALGVGASMPLMFPIFGNMTDQFVEVGKYGSCFNISTDWRPAPPSCEFDKWSEKDPNCLPYANDYDIIGQCNQEAEPKITNATDRSCKSTVNLWPAEWKDKDGTIWLPLPNGGRVWEFNCDYLVNQADPDQLFFCYDTSACQAVFNETHQEIVEAITTDIMGQMLGFTLYYVYLGIGTWILAWIQTTFLMMQANDQVNFIRKKFFYCILRQDIGFFDTNSVGELNTRLAEDIKKISDGMGDKIGITVQSLSRFVAGLAIAFYYGWELALVILAIAPILMTSAGIMFKITSSFTKKELDAYAAAGAIAEEVLNSIKTVTAFGGQTEEGIRYDKYLVNAKDVGIKRSLSTGLSIGTLFLVLFCSYGLAFWYGGVLITDPTKDYTIGRVMTVFFGVLTGAFSLSAVGQNIEFFASARAAAHSVFEIVDREPTIDIMSDSGEKPKKITGNVSLKNIDFTYPARLDQQVLKKVSFEAKDGQTVALCGQSGCGKSTCIQLIQRFYDPQGGTIEIGGYDIKKMNVQYLRNMIGVVSQEPTLFETTVIENIRYGRLDVTDEEIYKAAKQANAFNFIERLPKKWDTFVGEGGATLSGGQKQRVAIARALVRNPKILLLDEATSALDTESESIVQKALEDASHGRTTIVIAHRLSTIKNADVIIGFANGEVKEVGNHESLMNKENGVYANLCNMQTFDKGEEGEKKKLDRQISKEKEAERVDTTEKKELDEDLPDSPWSQIMGMNKPELVYICFGTLCSAIVGAAQPMFAIIFSEIIALFSQYENDPDTLLKELSKWAGAFCGIGGLNFFGNLGALALFGKSGEELTMRLRSKAFRKYLSFEMSYFDDPLNSTGALTTRLATDASRVQGATGSRIALVVQNLASLGFAFTIAFYYCWQLTLVCLCFVPIMALSGFAAMAIFSGKVAENERKAYEEAGKIATEATLNIRTVASLAREQKFYSNYVDQMNVPAKASSNKSILYGIAYGSSQGVIFFAYAGCFYFGSWLIQEGILPPEEYNSIYKVLMAVVFGAMAVGQSSAFAPDFGEAQLSARRIIKLFDKQSLIDPSDTSGERPSQCKGQVTIKGVEFTYPTRPDIKILKGLTVSVEPGQTLALVGQSGCGKSTLIQLLERFYDTDEGRILIDGKKIKKLNIQWLRQQIGFVQQEPILFDKTIKENILYGYEEPGQKNPAYLGDDGKPTKPTSSSVMKAIENATKEANAYDFIKNLPSGLDTNCGKKGSQLSGGQKQRIAIARALIRKPKILLLDEATSALDAESERIVQDALDKARKGRTCILIAHRLSTVINADKIAVVDNGEIVEIGTHEELLKQQGAYYSLINSQL